MNAQEKEITRKAILISSPGTGDDFLKGTQRDLENMFNFLTSPRGGFWDANEIVILNDPGWRYAKRVIDNNHADYLLIYFSGHGYANIDCRYLNFKNIAVQDTALFNASPKQLIIADSCRRHLRVVSGIPPAEEDWLSFTGESWARQAFDDALKASPDGLMIVHATHDSAPAIDLRGGMGGAFTYCLLSTTLFYHKPGKYSAISIRELLPVTTDLLHDSGFDQRPEAFGSDNLHFPFLIDADQTQVINTQDKQLALISARTKDNEWSAVAGMVAAVAAVVLITKVVK